MPVKMEEKSAKKKVAVKKAAVKKAVEKNVAAQSVTATQMVDSITNSTPAAKTKKTTESNSYVIIDHPINSETVYQGHYAIKIGASGDGFVEISFNDGDWKPCRNNSGFWWYDWSDFSTGATKIVARLRNETGKTIKKSNTVKCEVI